MWNATDDDLAGLVADTVAELGLPPLRFASVRVRRLRHVYPVYARGYAEHLRGLDAWAAALPRVTTFGRLGLFVHDNTHHAIAMAYDAVEVLGTGPGPGRRDEPAWAAARERFTHHVVED